MKTNDIEHQIEQFMRDGHTTDQIGNIIGLPAEQVKALCSDLNKQRDLQKTKATNQHSQAIYAMSLHA
ncbi:hypothetical protein [Amphritea japonica]|uniref:hypothetical protein n=1 Tax=Amphritea japonica TaxID=452627 RepID=UPI000373C08D|nr:hypothetical protein [Amphritea japonica]